MNKNIAIIGAGQLGSRHLQSLSKLNQNEYRIFIIDPCKDSVEKAIDIYRNEPGKKALVTSLARITDLPEQVDIVIVATSANVRASVVKELLESKKVNLLVLEKVLFQTLEEYELIEALLKKTGTQAYVNCPRRMVNTFKELKKLFAGTDAEVRVSGTEWGLGCNLIHMLDLAAFVLGQPIKSINVSGLDNKISESKRSGFVEFYGNVEAEFKLGKLVALCTKGGTVVLETCIENDGYMFSYSSENNYFELLDKSNSSSSKVEFRMPYQSELTSLLVEQWSESEECSLTSFEESKKLHVELISKLLCFYNKQLNTNSKILPIT